MYLVSRAFDSILIDGSASIYRLWCIDAGQALRLLSSDAGLLLIHWRAIHVPSAVPCEINEPKDTVSFGRYVAMECVEPIWSLEVDEKYALRGL